MCSFEGSNAETLYNENWITARVVFKEMSLEGKTSKEAGHLTSLCHEVYMCRFIPTAIYDRTLEVHKHIVSMAALTWNNYPCNGQIHHCKKK